MRTGAVEFSNHGALVDPRNSIIIAGMYLSSGGMYNARLFLETSWVSLCRGLVGFPAYEDSLLPNGWPPSDLFTALHIF